MVLERLRWPWPSGPRARPGAESRSRSRTRADPDEGARLAVDGPLVGQFKCDGKGARRRNAEFGTNAGVANGSLTEYAGRVSS